MNQIAGEYQNTSGQSSCNTCLVNTMSKHTNSTNCVDCPLGRFSGTGAASCSGCAAGTIINSTTEECVGCTKGQYRGSTDNDDECLDCPIGFSQNEARQASCTKCSPGEFNDVAGAVQCKQCLNSTYYDEKGRNTSCIDCPIGWSSEDGSAKCVACGAGTFGEGCKKCPIGYARNGTDLDTTKCRQCELGETTSILGATTCEKCDLGTYGNSKGKCLACSAGQYQDGKGATRCVKCEKDTYLKEPGKSSKADCVACSKDKSTGTSTANTNELSCRCKKRQSEKEPGFYTESSSKCQPCPSGANCATRDGMLLSELFALPGYYRPDIKSDTFISCHQGYTPPTPVSPSEERCCPLNPTTNVSICNTMNSSSIGPQCRKE